jgi:cytochrome c peroxidase
LNLIHLSIFRKSEDKMKVHNIRKRVFLVMGIVGLVLVIGPVQAHIIPPEKIHPVAEVYRRVNFILNLNPIVWDQVQVDVDTLAENWKAIDPKSAEAFHKNVNEIISAATAEPNEEKGIEPLPRSMAAKQVFQNMTRAVSDLCLYHIEMASMNIDDREVALKEVREAEGIWNAFYATIEASDPEGHKRLGKTWIKMANALGSTGLLGIGGLPPDRDTFQKEAGILIDYIEANFGKDFHPIKRGKLAPWPSKSPTFNSHAKLPAKLPPGHNINKQIPRPRQILGIAARGVDEGETPLIALGDMAFDSAYIYGEPMRSLQMSCNTCHNKSITNPNFIIPGLSSYPGGMDVSSNFFAPHANNGVFDPLDIPDLRGIRFTAPYGRNGRFGSLREFVRNVIVNEFNGDEPDPMLLDGMIAYMNEFEFLSNPYLKKDGRLNENASKSAKRGEEIFHTEFTQMGNMSCATCHIPSANFIDHKRHDIGTVNGHEAYSMDRTMDTPTLLSSKYSPPYFHDGSQPTLGAVVSWFDKNFKLGLKDDEIEDLTSYVETVGDGIDAYEDTVYYLDAEMEEFNFFLSAYEFLEEKNKPGLMGVTFITIAQEIRNHKWELQDPSVMPVMDKMAEIMDAAYAASQAGDQSEVRHKVAEYRAMYNKNSDVLK